MEDNEIFVGQKPTDKYVLGCITQFNNGEEEVHIKARGRSISRAVDTSQRVVNDFSDGAEIEDVILGTDEMEDEDRKVKVSTIEIVVAK